MYGLPDQTMYCLTRRKTMHDKRQVKAEVKVKRKTNMVKREVFTLLSTFAFTVACLLTGCAVGPNFQRPAPPNVDRYTPQPLPAQTASVEVKGGEAQSFVQDMDIPGQWWTLFHSKPLNDLIEQALKANPDLEAAQAALRVAWENVFSQQGAFFPSVDASFNPTRQKTAGVLSSPLANGSNIFSLHTA